MSTTLLTSPKQRESDPFAISVLDDEAPIQEQENQYGIEVAEARVSTQEFEEIEVELGTKTFWIQKDKLSIRAYNPPVIAYKSAGEDEWFEVRNWSLKVDVSATGWAALPDQIARHFFEQYSHAQESGLSDEEQLAFARICQQVDYKTFCAEFDPKRYMECTLVHKLPEPRLRSSSGAIYKLTHSLVDNLYILNEGDYFGAEFTFSPTGSITNIDSPRLLTKPDISQIDRLLPRKE